MPGPFSDALKQARGNTGAINVLSALNAKAASIAVTPRPPVGPPRPGFPPSGPPRPGFPPVGPHPPVPPVYVPPTPPPRPPVGPPITTPPQPPSPPTLGQQVEPMVQQLAASLLTGILTAAVKSLQGELDPDQIDLDQLFVRSPSDLLREQGITQEEIDRILNP